MALSFQLIRRRKNDPIYACIQTQRHVYRFGKGGIVRVTDRSETGYTEILLTSGRGAKTAAFKPLAGTLC